MCFQNILLIIGMSFSSHIVFIEDGKTAEQQYEPTFVRPKATFIYVKQSSEKEIHLAVSCA